MDYIRIKKNEEDDWIDFYAPMEEVVEEILFV